MNIVIPKVLKKWDTLFFILLIGMSYLYSYNQILWLRPCSSHIWRQCDCLSITLNYYKEGMHFFRPTVHNCGIRGDGLTCPTEFPFIYYVVAFLWKIFGYHEYIFRLLDTLIGYAGLYALYKLTKELLNDGAWALMIALLLFTSPIFVFYTNNFIMDTPGLSMALIGWYFFVKYYKTRRLLFFHIAILIFLFAGLTKITALISFVPLIVFFTWELFRKNKNPGKKLFTNPFKQGLAIFLLVSFICIWVAYSGYYRNLHNAGFFLTIQNPIWTLDKDTISNVLNKLYNNLLPQYFSMPIIFLTLILFISMLINYKKMNPFYYWFILMVFIGCILYILVWFSNFEVHDYYLINALIFIPAALVSFLVFLKKNYPSVFNSNKVKLIFAIILTVNIYYCSVEINIRYIYNTLPIKNSFLIDKQTKDFWDWCNWEYENHTKALETITPYLRSLGISRTDKIISMPDGSPDISLYLMDQKGYNDEGLYITHERFPKYINSGVKYLIVSNPSLLDSTWLQPYLKNKIGIYKNVTIYNLRNL